MKIPKNTNLVVNICRVFYARCDQVSFNSGTDQFHKAVVFPAGKKWNEIYFTTGSADFTENGKTEDPGMLYEQVLKMIYPGEDESKVMDAEDLYYPLIIMMKTTSGSFRIFGCPVNPVKWMNNKLIGTKSRSELSFSCLAQEPAWWHDTPVTTLPD